MRVAAAAGRRYYDIFVHHAFGSYRDIMKEVSVSPVMGQYVICPGLCGIDIS